MKRRVVRQVETGKLIVWVGDRTVGNMRRFRWHSPVDWLALGRWKLLPNTRRHRWACIPQHPHGPAAR